MTKPKCIHYWGIDSYNVGKCIKCGKVREFPKAHLNPAYNVKPKKGANSGVREKEL